MRHLRLSSWSSLAIFNENCNHYRKINACQFSLSFKSTLSSSTSYLDKIFFIFPSLCITCSCICVSSAVTFLPTYVSKCSTALKDKTIVKAQKFYFTTESKTRKKKKQVLCSRTFEIPKKGTIFSENKFDTFILKLIKHWRKK